MNLQEKMKRAREDYEEQERRRRLNDPRAFPPPPDLEMVERWEPVARWKYKTKKDYA